MPASPVLEITVISFGVGCELFDDVANKIAKINANDKVATATTATITSFPTSRRICYPSTCIIVCKGNAILNVLPTPGSDSTHK